jgi:exosortase A
MTAAILACGLAVLTLLFWPEGAAAIHVWQTSTAYGHCWLVLPISLWLMWERRACLRTLPTRPIAWPCVAAIPCVLLWLAADALGIMEGRQLAAMALLLLFVLALLGPRLWWALSPGLLYLFFLVPFGAFLTPALQNFTAWFIGAGLDLLGIPNQLSALRIDIPEGSFYVAEACAGLRFLIASIAFGVLFAVTMYRSPGRRAAFIAASCIVPVIANGFRGLGIVLLGHMLGSAQAAATDHVIYGWVFFTTVLLILAVLGMAWREAPDAPPAPQMPEAARARQTRPILVAAAVLLIASCGPAVGWWLDDRATPSAATKSAFIAPPGCTISPDAAGDFLCGGTLMHTTTAVLPRRANPARVVALARANATRGIPDPDFSTLDVPDFSPSRWVLVMDQETGQAGAYLLWVDGAPALGGLHDRLALARDLLTGSPDAPIAVTVSTATGGAAPLLNFLSKQGDLPGRLTAAAMTR